MSIKKNHCSKLTFYSCRIKTLFYGTQLTNDTFYNTNDRLFVLRNSKTIWSNGQGTRVVERSWFDSACGYVGFSLTIVPNERPLHCYFAILHFTKQLNNNEYILYRIGLLKKRLLFCYLLMIYFTKQQKNNKYVF